MRAKDAEEAKRKLDCQITKYQMCLGCRACESVCRFSAIKVRSFANDTNTVADKMADFILMMISAGDVRSVWVIFRLVVI